MRTALVILVALALVATAVASSSSKVDKHRLRKMHKAHKAVAAKAKAQAQTQAKAKAAVDHSKVMEQYEKFIDSLNARFRQTLLADAAATIQDEADAGADGDASADGDATVDEPVSDEVDTASNDEMAEEVPDAAQDGDQDGDAEGDEAEYSGSNSGDGEQANDTPKTFLPLLLDGSKQPELSGTLHKPVMVDYSVSLPSTGSFKWDHVPASMQSIKASPRSGYQLYAETTTETKPSENLDDENAHLIPFAQKIKDVEDDEVHENAVSSHTAVEIAHWKKRLASATSKSDIHKFEKHLKQAEEDHRLATEVREQEISINEDRKAGIDVNEA